jgi:hypothetical protein
MTILRVDTLSGIGTNGPVFDGDFEFNSQNYVILPKGTTDDRVGVGSTPGALRYNTDSNKVELWDGSQWVEVQSSRPDLNGGARGLFGGGTPTTGGNIIDYINISSTGNAIDFGDLSGNTKYISAFSSSTRGVWGGGERVPAGNQQGMEYITISSTGNVTTFGNLTSATTYISGCSNATRGLFAGGRTPGFTNVIEYVTITSTGNAQDFGDLSVTRSNTMASSNSTRGIFGGGYTPVHQNIIDFVTIATLGSATDFGDLTLARNGSNAASSKTRCLFFVGDASPYTTIDFVNYSTLGNAIKFGDSTGLKGYSASTSNCIRGVSGGGQTPTSTNSIEYVIISTQSNSVDFGDLTTDQHLSGGSCSNAHGGL